MSNFILKSIVAKYFFNLKLSLLVLAGVLFNVAPTYAMTCKIDVPVRTDTFPLQGANITVGNELPLGTILYRQNITSTKDYTKAPHGMCDGTGPFTDRQYLYLTQTPMALSSWQGGTYAGKIYNTNVPGIGVVVAHGNVGVTTAPYQWWSDTRASITHIQVWRTTTLIFVKTGNVSPGSINGTSLPTITYRNDYTVANGSSVVFSWKPYVLKFSGNLRVISQTCSVSDFSVDLGSWDVTKIMTNKASDWRDATIKMTNCPRFYGYINTAFGTEHISKKVTGLTYKSNAIGLRLNGVYGNYDATKGIIKLEQTKGSASGVGVQISSGSVAANTVLNFNAEKRINVANSTSTSLTIPLVARYIQTESKVTPGIANSKAMFTINYY